MHECPECHQMCDCSRGGGDDVAIDCTHCPYPGFEDDYDDGDYGRDWERMCVDCGAPGIDCCQCCGGYLCGMHGETGAGFCRNCPTQEWIDEQQEDTRQWAQREARENARPFWRKVSTA